MGDKLDQLNDNLPEISVSELSNQVKFTVETAFGRVRVRGEISRPKKAASGHLYLTLKDDRSVIDGVCWKGNAQRLTVQPEEGMDVICTGKITTYPMQSKYQMVIEKIELAGEGALLKLLEERRKKLADEGLFDREKKQALPKFPKIIGVVTSPTGSVIRDIIHRIEDRFPLRVIIWPVLVQGNKAAEQITKGIEGFEKLREIDPSLGPDVLIVARGGGSLEDLWPFNEENVVRAVSNSTIPLISAIGHETDTTLIDFVADVRAPTPTAAAELAVPVRSDLLSRVIENERRLLSSINRSLNDFKLKLEGFSRGLGDPDRIIEERAQRFDYSERRLFYQIKIFLEGKEHLVNQVANRLPAPELQIERKVSHLSIQKERLENFSRRQFETIKTEYDNISNKFHVKHISQKLEKYHSDLDRLINRKEQALVRLLENFTVQLTNIDRLLEASSFQRTLDRGFVLVRDENDIPVFESSRLHNDQLIKLSFQDGSSKARVIKEVAEKPRRKQQSGTQQESLF